MGKKVYIKTDENNLEQVILESNLTESENNLRGELIGRVDQTAAELYDDIEQNFLQNVDLSDVFKIVDNEGNVGLKLDSNGLHALDFIADVHKLSEKANNVDLINHINNVQTHLRISDIINLINKYVIDPYIEYTNAGGTLDRETYYNLQTYLLNPIILCDPNRTYRLTEQYYDIPEWIISQKTDIEGNNFYDFSIKNWFDIFKYGNGEPVKVHEFKTYVGNVYRKIKVPFKISRMDGTDIHIFDLEKKKLYTEYYYNNVIKTYDNYTVLLGNDDSIVTTEDDEEIITDKIYKNDLKTE